MSKDGKGALILTHLRTDGSCSMGRVLNERGFRIKTLSAPLMDLSKIDPLRPDFLMIMGGPIGVYQREDYPFLEEEIRILKARLAADKPTIGICLGSQLMATALGSTVYPGENGKEIGWNPLQITDAGKDTPIRHLGGDYTNMFHWHGDTFDLPENATLLASSNKYKNQAFQSGENCLGLQCHPETGHDQIKERCIMFTHQVTGENSLVSLDELRMQTTKHIEGLNIQVRSFFNEWLEERGF